MKTDFFKKNFGNQIYAVSCPQWATAPYKGEPVMTSWVIVGSKTTLAIDSGVPEVAGFREYLEAEFGLPVILMASHGHYDHMGCNTQFEEVWLNEKDWPLLLNDFTGNLPYHTLDELPYRLHNIKDGDMIDLGGRTLKALEIQGHTRGSIMLYEAATASLFSGDSVARRILYGLQDWVPLAQYLDTLSALSALRIDAVYSMHDAFALFGRQPEKIIRNIVENIESTNVLWEIPGSELKFLRILSGENEEDPDFFDFVMPLSRKAETINELGHLPKAWTHIPHG